MSASAALQAGRQLAESLMVDMCTAARPGQPVTAPDGRTVIPQTPVYAGVCRVRSESQYEQTPESAGATAVVQRYVISWPVGVYSPVAGDLVTVAEAVDNPDLTGRVFRVAGPHRVSQSTAMRCYVEEVT